MSAFCRANLAVIAISASLLCACTPAPEPEQAAVIADTASNTATTIHNLMRTQVKPNVDAIWNAVSYVATVDGVTETSPQTDADWAGLRANALALIDAAAALQQPGLAVAADPNEVSTADWLFTPDEIAQSIADDPQAWNRNLEQMQESTRLTLMAIELRDLAGLTDFGARINGACQNCHAQYWYRPLL
jgi:hypothetical protein